MTSFLTIFVYNTNKWILKKSGPWKRINCAAAPSESHGGVSPSNKIQFFRHHPVNRTAASLPPNDRKQKLNAHKEFRPQTTRGCEHACFCRRTARMCLLHCTCMRHIPQRRRSELQTICKKGVICDGVRCTEPTDALLASGVWTTRGDD